MFRRNIRWMGVHVVTGSRYLGHLVGEPVLGKACMEEKLKGWMDSSEVLAGVARLNLQTIYAGLQKSLQQEWDFFQKTTPGIGEYFFPVKEALKNTSSWTFCRGNRLSS